MGRIFEKRKESIFKTAAQKSKLYARYGKLLYYAAGALTFSVLETGAMTKEFSAEWGGVVRPRLPWRTTVVE